MATCAITGQVTVSQHYVAFVSDRINGKQLKRYYCLDSETTKGVTLDEMAEDIASFGLTGSLVWNPPTKIYVGDNVVSPKEVIGIVLEHPDKESIKTRVLIGDSITVHRMLVIDGEDQFVEVKQKVYIPFK